jgi:hypothetical protein
VALLEQLTGLQINRGLRETVSELLDDDEQSGLHLGQVALTGLPNLTGWDFQSRLSLGNALPGVSDLNGFQPEAALGPVSGMISSLVKGGYKVRQGQAPVDWVPPVLRKLVKLGTDDWMLRDYRDRPIGELTTGDVVGSALGVNPTKVSQFNVASRIVDRADEHLNREESSFRQRLAKLALQGQFGTVKMEVLARSQEQGESYNLKNALVAIAKSAEEQAFVRDLRREGTTAGADMRERLLKTFSLPESGATEADRVRFRQQMLTQLGVPMDQERAAQTAELMDQLRQRNPTATRLELKRQAEKLLRGRA